jgi:2-polyprenyl-3-methyl-5-hydroxy-6-metoxy-1,4-benzoquinol methylase/tetratricopeptide (TPR) repeat protein
MNMPPYRIEEWYQFILKNKGVGSFVCVGDFPPELGRKFAAIGLSFRSVHSIDELDSSCDRTAWILDNVSEDDAILKLAPAAKQRQPARIYFELAPEGMKGRRPEIELAFFEAGYRKSACYHLYVEFSDSCYLNRQFAFEHVPGACLKEFGNQYGTNQAEAGLHRDMLRDTDRRADAHTIRYHWASQYIRCHDIVLDAACGLGYGSSIIAHNSECARVLGLDNSDYAIRYAQSAYTTDSQRLEFSAQNVADLSHLQDHSVHAVVSFETLEHLPDPTLFLKECRRVLIPGGRFLCSVPNDWTDENGQDPNPHHLQVYTKETLLGQLSEFFLIEHVFSQKAGGGFLKFDQKTRTLSEVGKSSPADEAEWWLAVGTKDPVGAPKEDFANHFFPQMEAPGTNLGAFGRDHDHPWMIYPAVIRGLRTKSREVLQDLVGRELKEAQESSADRGAALCVLGYQYLEQADRSPLGELRVEIEDYLGKGRTNPHQIRWRISLKFLLGRICLEFGDSAKAREYFLSCADEDCLTFGPTLGTKPVEALFIHGWLLFQEKKTSEAIKSWQRAIAETERIFKNSDWHEIYGREDLPFDYGLGEAMIILQKAQQCAFAIYAVNSGAYERDQLDHEIIHNSVLRNGIKSGIVQQLADHNRSLMDQRNAHEAEIRRLREKSDRMQADNERGREVVSTQTEYIQNLQKELEKKDKIIKKIQSRL